MIGWQILTLGKLNGGCPQMGQKELIREDLKEVGILWKGIKNPKKAKEVDGYLYWFQ